MLFWTELRTYFSLCVFNAELCGTRARPQHLLHSLQSSFPGLRWWDHPSPKHLQRGKRRPQQQDCKVFSLLEKGRDAGGSRGSCKKLSITGKPGFGALLKHISSSDTQLLATGHQKCLSKLAGVHQGLFNTKLQVHFQLRKPLSCEISQAGRGENLIG